MDSTLLKYSAKDHFFKAGLCHFCVDHLNAKVRHHVDLMLMCSHCRTGLWFSNHGALSQLAVQKYEEMFPAFSDSRECKLLKVSLKSFSTKHPEIEPRRPGCNMQNPSQ